MTRSVARRPDNFQFAITDGYYVPVSQVFVGLRHRTIGTRTHPHWPHAFKRILLDREAMGEEEFSGLRTCGWRPHGQHPSDALHFKLMQERGCITAFSNYRRSA